MVLSRSKFSLVYFGSVCLTWAIVPGNRIDGFFGALEVLPLLVIAFFVFLAFGAVLTKKVNLTVFVALSLALNVIFSVLVAAFNQSIDAGDGTFVRNFLSVFLLIASFGVISAFGFALPPPAKVKD